MAGNILLSLSVSSYVLVIGANGLCIECGDFDKKRYSSVSYVFSDLA